ncbi:Gfo/Idh/MocA family oxidoreductase [Sulfuritalea sp.]|uniref:Gfo/Idh/MocA family protein n=1 Tax=Sulfuritalea sp. TaxID=2480090 RepID=UPI001ACB6570|nr:Gfo/Idh/MocA family oxidoreductase [Sulfuritalea sp.]MBN8473943.1 Gfo/Idh/MocA family oxidoreductase [Sulfuritalea sp.]
MKDAESIRRALIVGQGSIGKRHLRLARTLMPDVDIRVLRHRDNEAIPEFANGSFSRVDDAIGFAPQLAVIANPATFHLGMAQPLAKSGTHLLVEKPLAATLDGVSQLIDTCRERGAVLMIGYNLRFLPSLRRFRDLLSQNVIGRVLSVRCEVGQFLPSWRSDTDYRQGVSARSELGGGALLELSHEIDYLRWIFGEVDWVQAALSRQSTLEIDVEDTAHLVLGFVPGADGRRLVGTLSLDFIRHDTTRSCTAIGAEGSLRWNGLTGSVERFDPGASQWSEIFCHQHQRDDSYLEEWQHFLECIKEREAPLVAGEDGLRALQIIEAARQASVSGVQMDVAKRPSENRIDA